jgi:hypothetical protein
MIISEIMQDETDKRLEGTLQHIFGGQKTVKNSIGQ